MRVSERKREREREREREWAREILYLGWRGFVGKEVMFAVRRSKEEHLGTMDGIVEKEKIGLKDDGSGEERENSW